MCLDNKEVEQTKWSHATSRAWERNMKIDLHQVKYWGERGRGGGGGGAHMETATPVDSSACPLRVESLRSVSTLVTGK